MIILSFKSNKHLSITLLPSCGWHYNCRFHTTICVFGLYIYLKLLNCEIQSVANFNNTCTQMHGDMACLHTEIVSRYL